MRTDLRALCALALALSGCATTSIRSDLLRIERLGGWQLPEGVLAPVGAELDAEIDTLLARPLDAERAVRIAIARNRELRASLRELGVERGALRQASLLPNPEIEVDFRPQRDPGQSFQLELFAALEITRALLTPLRVQAASRDLEAARLRAAARVVETEYEVRAAFYAAQAAEQRLEVGMRALDAIAAARDAAVMLFQAGNVPELDVATQIAAYEEARATTAELELARAEARERLSRLLGLHGHATQWTIAEPLRLESEASNAGALTEQLERMAIESSLELREMQLRLEATGRRIRLARAEGWIPHLRVGVHAEQEGQTRRLGGGASISLPIFDRNEGTTAAHEARFDALMERHEGAAIEIRSAARDARNRLASAELRARQYTEVIVPARQHVLRQTLLQYNAMQVGVFQLVAALRAQLAAELEAIEALRVYWTARAEVDALVRGRRASVAPASIGSVPAAGDGLGGGH